MKKAILVVDDMPNIRQSLKELLQDEGYFVATGGSGEQTLQILAETHFDILFLDVKLPGIDGLTTLKRLQQLQPRPKVIMISGEADLEMAVQATQLGAYNFLEKPLKPEKVLLEVKNIFDRQQVESEV
ncbi:response regulator, partial [candidate division KSB1 bacterium]|nr:response regulator [candidate division KSB1 bacterium]